MKKVLVVFLSISALAILSGCSSASATAIAATTEPVKADPLIISEGRVEPIQFAEIGFNSSGTLKEVLVEEGDTVKAGQVLMRLDNVEALQAEVVRAEEAYLVAQQTKGLAQTETLQDLASASEAFRAAQQKLDDFSVPSEFDGMTSEQSVTKTYQDVEKARKAYEPYFGYKRTNRYVKDLGAALDDAWADYNKAVKWMTLEANLENAQIQVDQAQAEFTSLSAGDGTASSITLSKFKTAEANLASAKAALNNAELKSPFTGTIASLDAKPGESVSAGLVVVKVADFSNWVVKTTDLTEIDVVNLTNGQVANVTLDALPQNSLTGKIISIGQTYTEVQGDTVYEVTVQMADILPQMRWGMTAEVKFNRE
jgi:HlyD family secretion protein